MLVSESSIWPFCVPVVRGGCWLQSWNKNFRGPAWVLNGCFHCIAQFVCGIEELIDCCSLSYQQALPSLQICSRMPLYLANFTLDKPPVFKKKKKVWLIWVQTQLGKSLKKKKTVAPVTWHTIAKMKVKEDYVIKWPSLVFLLLFRVGSLHLHAISTSFTLFLGSKGSMNWRWVLLVRSYQPSFDSFIFLWISTLKCWFYF